MATPGTAAKFLAALKAEGLKVREIEGWRTHNRNHKGAWGPLHGVMLHHTAGGESGSDGILSNGISGLPGPLCHGGIHKDGTVSLHGWGRANHAGGGDPDVLAAIKAERYPLPKTDKHDGEPGSVDGNAHFIGYECVNKGDGKDPWPPIQLEAMARAVAAACRLYGWTVNSALRHMDWSDWKPDPKGVDWGKMRTRIATILAGPPNATPIGNWVDGDADGSGTTPPTKPTEPKPPAGSTFPGASKFGPGANNAHVTKLGQMLVQRGAQRFYAEGPGPRWSDADRNATQAFQRAQGWTGADADGIPGPRTWDLLVSGKGKSIPSAPAAKPVVSLARVVAAYRRDPGLPQGGTTHPADVRLVEAALAKLGFLSKTYAADGSFGTISVAAYNAFRRSIGLKGSDATGAPGKQSLATLGSRSGLFTVTN